MGLRRNKTSIRNLLIIGLVLIIVVGAFAIAYYGFGTNKVSKELTVQEAQELVDKTFESIPSSTAMGAISIFDNTSIKVNSVSVGDEKNLAFDCTYTTFIVKGILLPHLDGIFTNVYDTYLKNNEAGKKTNATKINLLVRDDINNLLVNSTDKFSGEVVINAYETEEGVFTVYLDDKMVDTCTGGLLSVIEKIEDTDSINYNGEVVNIKNLTTIRTGIVDSISLNNYSSEKPYTGTALQKAVAEFKEDFHKNFIEKDRWKYLLNGLGTTLSITGLSVIVGIFLGFLVAVIRCTNQTTGKMKIPDAICRLYLTVIRGTPLMVQLLIIYFVILLPMQVPKMIAAVTCFGLNSGAYVAEIVRGGIMSVDKGQMEAGRSLGFNYAQSMIHFIIPQAFKAVLPSLANEFITLLKESSVAFYIGVADLTQGGLKIRSVTFSNFMPLIAVAIIYLILVLVLTYLVGILERRLRKSDH